MYFLGEMIQLECQLFLWGPVWDVLSNLSTRGSRESGWGFVQRQFSAACCWVRVWCLDESDASCWFPMTLVLHLAFCRSTAVMLIRMSMSMRACGSAMPWGRSSPAHGAVVPLARANGCEAVSQALQQYSVVEDRYKLVLSRHCHCHLFLASGKKLPQRPAGKRLRTEKRVDGQERTCAGSTHARNCILISSPGIASKPPWYQIGTSVHCSNVF